MESYEASRGVKTLDRHAGMAHGHGTCMEEVQCKFGVSTCLLYVGFCEVDWHEVGMESYEASRS